MALLLISAAAEQNFAAPGNTGDLVINVAVTSSAGVPVTGLTAANFSLGFPRVPPGGATSVINSFSASGLSGCYDLHLRPSAGNWLAGTYLYDIRVVNGADQATTNLDVTVS